MSNIQLKIQKTSRNVSVAMNVLKYFLIFGLVMLVLVSIWYADACSLHQAEAMGIWGNLLESMMPMVPTEAKLQPVFFVCLMLQMVDSVLFIALTGQLAKLFRDIGRKGNPFDEAYIRPIRRVWKLALAMFVEGTVKYGLESAMEAGFVGFLPDLDLGWVAALALVYCLTHIFEYGCQLQREADETL